MITFGLYASEAYLARHSAPDFARRCAGHTFVTATDDMNNLADYEWLPPLTSNARIAERTNGREPMARLAAAGAGIACLPRCMGDGMPALRRIETPEPSPARQLWLGVHRGARATPRVRVVFGLIAHSLAQLRAVLRPVGS